MKRYAIWNKQSPIITPIYEVLSADQWKERYPVAKLDSMTIVCSAGDVNGGFFGILSQMVRHAESNGADFSACTTDEEKLEAYEAWEDAMNAPAEGVTSEELTATSLASIAASMEFQNMMSLDDVEEV